MSEKSGPDRYLRTSLRMLGPGIRGYLSAVSTLTDLVAPEQSVTCFVTSFYRLGTIMNVGEITLHPPHKTRASKRGDDERGTPMLARRERQ